MLRLLKLAVALALLATAVPLTLTVLYATFDPPALPILRRQWAGEPVAQTWRPLEAFAPSLVRGVVMAEDARFCLHSGVDTRQLGLVLGEALDGGPSRGASTITMQVVKNLFLWPDRSYLRKAIEIPLALWMDLVLPKQRILEIYLNVAQWGPAIYGAAAAAEHHFASNAAELTTREALALATMLPAPAVRDPARPGARHRALIAHVERELARAPWVFSCLPPSLRP